MKRTSQSNGVYQDGVLPVSTACSDNITDRYRFTTDPDRTRDQNWCSGRKGLFRKFGLGNFVYASKRFSRDPRNPTAVAPGRQDGGVCHLEFDYNRVHCRRAVASEIYFLVREIFVPTVHVGEISSRFSNRDMVVCMPILCSNDNHRPVLALKGVQNRMIRIITHQ